MDGSLRRRTPGQDNRARRAARRVAPETCMQCGVQAHCMLSSTMGRDGAPELHTRAFGAGDALVVEGAIEQEMKVIRTGLVYGSLGAVDGPRPTGFLSRGTLIGKSSYHDEPNPASVTAASEGAYCAAPTHAVVALAEQDPVFRRSFERIVARDLLALMQWVAALGRPGVAAQLAGTLILLAEAQHGNDVLLPSHTLLARLLGTTRETVARMLGQLEADGCLERHRPRQARVHPGRLRAWLAQDAQAGSGNRSVQVQVSAGPLPS